MRESLDEIMARHDALTACGCNCCDDDFCAYVEQQSRRHARERRDALPASAAEMRKSLRYQNECSSDR